MINVGKLNVVGDGKWDLKIVIKIGTLGFKRSEVKKKGEWTKNTELWVEPDTSKVEFYKLGQTNSSQLLFSFYV